MQHIAAAGHEMLVVPRLHANLILDDVIDVLDDRLQLGLGLVDTLLLADDDDGLLVLVIGTYKLNRIVR